MARSARVALQGLPGHLADLQVLQGARPAAEPTPRPAGSPATGRGDCGHAADAADPPSPSPLRQEMRCCETRPHPLRRRVQASPARPTPRRARRPIPVCAAASAGGTSQHRLLQALAGVKSDGLFGIGHLPDPLRDRCVGLHHRLHGARIGFPFRMFAAGLLRTLLSPDPTAADAPVASRCSRDGTTSPTGGRSRYRRRSASACGCIRASCGGDRRCRESLHFHSARRRRACRRRLTGAFRISGSEASSFIRVTKIQPFEPWNRTPLPPSFSVTSSTPLAYL